LVSGYWFLVIGFWLLVSGYWFLVVGFWLLVSGCWFLVVGFWLLVSGYWFLVIGFWLLVSGYWFLVVGYPISTYNQRSFAQTPRAFRLQAGTNPAPYTLRLPIAGGDEPRPYKPMFIVSVNAERSVRDLVISFWFIVFGL